MNKHAKGQMVLLHCLDPELKLLMRQYEAKHPGQNADMEALARDAGITQPLVKEWAVADGDGNYTTTATTTQRREIERLSRRRVTLRSLIKRLERKLLV